MYSTITTELIPRCVSPVVYARVPLAIVEKSIEPHTAARAAPTMPMPMSHVEPLAKAAGSSPSLAARSKTRLAVHAPMGMVTRIGWMGWP